jgi:glycosyltransferase involved in cell wall biosynthesis
VRVLAFIEALGVTGPARKLLALATHLELLVATLRRRSLGAAHSAGVEAFADAARARGARVHVLDERWRFDWRVLDGALELLGSLRPDIVESHHPKSHAVLALALRRGRVPWLAWHHGYTRTDLKVLAYNRLDSWSLPAADLVATTCAPSAREVVNAGVDGERVRVVHNAVDEPPAIDKVWARTQLGLERQRVVLSVGRLSREKGHDVLIDACARIGGVVRNELLVLFAGDGPQRARLERRARRQGVPVRFDGHQPNVAPYYAAADVFALPSRSEGSPNALLEAMAAGLPVAACAVGGVPEIADPRSAVLVPPDDPPALATALTRLLAFPELARTLGDNARAASRHFRTGRRAADVLSMYGALAMPHARGVAR